MKTLNTLLLILSICTTTQAQNKASQPTFSGKVIQNGPPRIDTITISYRPPYSSPTAGISHVEAVTDINGNFNLKMPHFEQPIQIAIRPRINGSVGFLYSYFYAEPTDHISMQLFKNKNGIIDSAHFSGTGASKYNLIARLSSRYQPWLKGKSITITPPENLEAYLDNLNNTVNELQSYKQALVKAARLTPQMERIITYSFANAYDNWLMAIKHWYLTSYKGKPAELELLKQHFNTYKRAFSFPEDEAMALAPSFLDKLAIKENLDLVMNAPGDTISLTKVYNVFKTKYTGSVRELLLANLFLTGKGRTDAVKFDEQLYNSLFSEAVKMINRPSLKFLMEHKLKILKGQEFFNAKFTDLAGKVFDSKTLKGKVILLDMWGTGCTGCAMFHQAFHPDFYPQLKDNPDFVYLAIGTNIRAENWKAGMASGKYTDPAYLNVYTSGQSLDHPFRKYYNIQGVPFLLLIGKDGKIFSSNITDAKVAFQCIQQALSSK